MDTEPDPDALSGVGLDCLAELRAVGMAIAEGLGRLSSPRCAPRW